MVVVLKKKKKKCTLNKVINWLQCREVGTIVYIHNKYNDSAESRRLSADIVPTSLLEEWILK